MRGKLLQFYSSSPFDRITPADAGKTVKRAMEWGVLQDHPRGCGENDNACACPAYSSGSPPRMRGKHWVADPSLSAHRITPADAGKTRISFYFPCSYWDHPRGCGENIVEVKWELFYAGSPPRMRGKLITPLQKARAARITPADAGKTRFFW